MCGRITLTVRPEQLIEEFGVQEVDEQFVPRYNLAPTQGAAVICDRDSARVQLFRWGLVPFWAKDLKIGSKLINARSDSVASKPAFRKSFEGKRCLILADGFYEWRTTAARRKQPYYISLKDRRPFAFAGLWASWRPAEGESVHSCSVITTDANALVGRLHDRMPVILPREARALWLDHATSPEVLRDLLRPYPAEEMESFAVSPVVNSPAHEGPDCLTPVQEQAELF